MNEDGTDDERFGVSPELMVYEHVNKGVEGGKGLPDPWAKIERVIVDGSCPEYLVSERFHSAVVSTPPATIGEDAIEFPPWRTMSRKQLEACFLALRDVSAGKGPTVRVLGGLDRSGLDNAYEDLFAAVARLIEGPVDGS